ncbi:MAG: hypothetical protein HOE86_24730, partial [Gemmatimonadetes bacterium]|nr:hypothetical protein [Gemmatimonadota bacterium]
MSINSASDLEEFRELGGTAFKLFGSLTIRNTELTDLTALSGLEEIEGGNLRIQGNSSLVSLQGLEKVRQVNELQIISNNALQSLEGLTGLRQ